LMSQDFLETLKRISVTGAGNIANSEFWREETGPTGAAAVVDIANLPSLEAYPLAAPSVDDAPYVNFDFSDYQSVEST
jgi:hypothetical protein